METEAGPGCVQPDGNSAVLLAEFRMWLDRERGLSPVSVRCYSKQSKAFLAAIGGAGAVSGLDAGRVTGFMVGWAQGRGRTVPATARRRRCILVPTVGAGRGVVVEHAAPAPGAVAGEQFFRVGGAGEPADRVAGQPQFGGDGTDTAALGQPG